MSFTILLCLMNVNTIIGPAGFFIETNSSANVLTPTSNSIVVVAMGFFD